MEKENVLLARQPIYNSKKEIVAYELLFRESDQLGNQTVSSGSFDGNRATSRVLLSVFTESDLTTVTAGVPAFINFTADLLQNPPLLDPEFIVIEILEDIAITPELVDALKHLKSKGFKLALDDFVMDDGYREVLPMVDIVKLELPQIGDQDLAPLIQQLRAHELQILAEKVETPEQFKRCRDLGCDLFQGYFLSKPEDIKGRKLAANQLSVIQLISEIQAPDADIPKLTAVIARDPGLSFKLLKLVNSAAYRRSREIESIQMAVTLLGLERIKSWASLLALSKLDDKPQALHHLALVRAIMCELIATHIEPNSKERFYTAGLLSCLDAFFDQPLEAIISQISLDSAIREALLRHQGLNGLALTTTICFEQAQWHKIAWDRLSDLGLSAKEINTLYLQAAKTALDINS